MWRTFATLVSKVATGPRQVSAREPPRNSRIPRRARAGGAPWRTASSRVFGRLIENACVGPPNTTRSISWSKSDNSSPARTTYVDTCPLRPAATARATSSVLPNIDSYTTMAFIPLPPRCPAYPGDHLPRTPAQRSLPRLRAPAQVAGRTEICATALRLVDPHHDVRGAGQLQTRPARGSCSGHEVRGCEDFGHRLGHSPDRAVASPLHNLSLRFLDRPAMMGNRYGRDGLQRSSRFHVSGL